MNFSKEQISQARKTNLYDFLMSNYSHLFKRQGHYIRFMNNKSINIKDDFCGYIDFATGETGNAVDFLTNYLDYTFSQAVSVLINESPSSSYKPYIPPKSTVKTPTIFTLPKANFNNDRLIKYLMKRGISIETIQMLIDKNLIYEDEKYHNIVFVNRQKNFAELRGTFDRDGKAFHSMLGGSRSDGCWCFGADVDKIKDVYICEASIDAISLYELHKIVGKNVNNNCYVSIVGCQKNATIDRLKSTGKHIIIAVDNDKAGQLCRDKHSDCEFVLPKNKDWNDDLLEFRRLDK